MSPTARLILTAKETLQGRSKLLVAEALEALADYWSNFHVLHLLSNGKERTIIADFLPVSSPQERLELEAKVKRAQETRAKEWEEHLASNPLTDEQKKQREERKEAKDKKKAEKSAANAAAAASAASSSSSSVVAAPAPAAAASASSSSSSAPPARKGGVGAGLATASWWDQYFDQHVEVVDWYLPNEVAMEALMPEIERACGIRCSDEEEGSSTTAQCSISSLRILQLGCGNSDITELLYNAGVRRMSNIDFSAVCIERMQALAAQKGWISAGGSPAFSFHSMDARALTFPSASFDFVFDKGTMDCVVLESDLGIEAGKAAVAEAWRVLRPGGVQVCFSLYPPAARATLWISVLSESDGGESAAEKGELLEILTQTDNPPRSFHTKAWSEVRMIALEHSPLELPNQQHTYLYIATKR